ncbi:MAG: LysM peptidoglycan-binding domain-containing protein [Verrucomicrobiota bacterium]
MKSPRMLLASAFAISLVSCANPNNNYDTGNLPNSPDGGRPAVANNSANPPVQATNPTYDTPAAYEESLAAPVATVTPEALKPPVATPPAKHPATTAAVPHGATVHTVVAGDTLGGIARKYKVPAASIKQANGMTKDTVVLGKKLQIPAH